MDAVVTVCVVVDTLGRWNYLRSEKLMDRCVNGSIFDSIGFT